MSKDGVVRIFSLKYKQPGDISKDGVIETNEYMAESNLSNEAILEVTNDIKIETKSESYTFNWSNTNDKFIVVGCKDAYVHVFNTLDGTHFLRVQAGTKMLH